MSLDLAPFHDLPDVVQGWVRQIFSEDVVELLRLNPDVQIEVRLYANGGKVRKQPVIVLNGGPGENVLPDDL